MGSREAQEPFILGMFPPPDLCKIKSCAQCVRSELGSLDGLVMSSAPSNMLLKSPAIIFQDPGY